MADGHSMNILYVASVIGLPWKGGGGSGGSTHTYEVATHLAARGHKVLVACRRFQKQRRFERLGTLVLCRIFDWEGAPYRLLKANRTVWNITRVPYYAIRSILHTASLVWLALVHRIDLVYERSAGSTIAGVLAARVLRIPLVLEVNDHSINPLVMNWCQAIVTPDLSSIPNRHHPKVLQLEWGVNTEVFRPGVECRWVRERFATEGRIVALFVGSGLPWHGLDDILEASIVLAQKDCPIVFMVVGDGERIQHLQEEVQRLGLEESFRFVGPFEHECIPAIVGAADIALAPYNSLLSKGNRHLIASPIKMFEYMACGKPVITTPLVNTRGILTHGDSAFIVPADSPTILADAIQLLAKDPLARQRLGQKARQAVEKYSWTVHCGYLDELFCALLKGPVLDVRRHRQAQ